MIQCWRWGLLRTESKLAQKMMDLQRRDFNRVTQMITILGQREGVHLPNLSVRIFRVKCRATGIS